MTQIRWVAWVVACFLCSSMLSPIAQAGPDAPASQQDHQHDDHDEHQDHDDHDDHGPIQLTAAQANALDLSSYQLKPLSLQTSNRYPVDVHFDPNRVAHLTPLVSGIVREVNVTLGDTVTKGQILAVLDSRELGEAKSRFLAAKASYELHLEINERQKQLWQKKILPEQDYLIATKELEEMRISFKVAKQALFALGLDPDSLDQLGETNYAFNKYFMKAPMDGIISNQHITPGELLDETNTAFQIIAPDKVWAMAKVFERDMRFLAKGQRAAIKFEALPDQIFEGIIDFIDNQLDPETRTVTARIILENPNYKLRDGMFGQVTLFSNQALKSTDSFLVPKACVQRSDAQSVVFRKLGERQFEKLVIEIVQETPDFVEISGTLASGDQLAMGDTFVLKSLSEKGTMGHGHSH